MTTAYRLTTEFSLADMAPQDLDQWATTVLERLFDEREVGDPDVSATLSTGQVTLWFDLYASSVQEAVDRAADVLRLVIRDVESKILADAEQERHVTAAPVLTAC